MISTKSAVPKTDSVGTSTQSSRSYRAPTMALCMCLLFAWPILATEYAVKRDGSGHFATIQACANAAQAGDTCLVGPGSYDERVSTARGGSSELARIKFRADGAVTMRGFVVNHSYITIDGFNITGTATTWQGYIEVGANGGNCVIENNRIRDGNSSIQGIRFTTSGSNAAGNCVIRSNLLSNLIYIFLTINGDSHLVENNIFEHQNGQDFIRLFGSNGLFRRNVFRIGVLGQGGNHPDWVQTFGPSKCENHVFEENLVMNLHSQLGQMSSADGIVYKGILYDNIRNITFRRNVFYNIAYNFNAVMPELKFINNTFVKNATELSGISYSGALTRGNGAYGYMKNNVFLAGGTNPAASNSVQGFYNWGTPGTTKEVIAVFVAKEVNQSGSYYIGPIADGIFADMFTINGYINSNGIPQAKALALTDISQFVFSEDYAGYKQAAYDTLMKTIALGAGMRSTAYADYNFVAGSSAGGYPAKRTSGCVQGAPVTPNNFCERNGINGGNPQLANEDDPLGPDGIPFTLDDGLKPRPGSPLCGRAEDGGDIGAYSCDPTKIFSGGAAQVLPPSSLRSTVR